MNEIKKEINKIKVIALRDIVMFPNMILPFYIARKKSINAANAAYNIDKKILLLTQKDYRIDDPNNNDLYKIGVYVDILQIITLPDGSLKLLVEGIKKAKILKLYDTEEYITADIEWYDDEIDDNEDIENIIKEAIILFEQFVRAEHNIPIEILKLLLSIEDNSKLADTIISYLSLSIPEKQKFLEIIKINEKFLFIIQLLKINIEKLQTQKKINFIVKNQIEKNQREFWLNEQLKAIKKELGEDEIFNDINELEKRIEKKNMSLEAYNKCVNEMNKLKNMPPISADASVSRNYIEYLISLPWKKKSLINTNLNKAKEILNKEYDGLNDIKERILEYLAVQCLSKKVKAPILCFVGPPGVGKTSLARSIALATGREFVRMSLGGVKDEAEIRGHRRTYVGALPGKIIQNILKCKCKNPLFLLDEIDKMSVDFRGDPASALLEVLDSEQNNTFMDHYIEIEFDLSDVMFVTTANSITDIPYPLLDRMEIIRLEGYTENEKIIIATNHLIPKQLKFNGLIENNIKINNSVIRDIIQLYTREAGVRNLERQISKIFRKVAKKILISNLKTSKFIITRASIKKYLGVCKYKIDNYNNDNKVGQVKGMAWTEFGGELLMIESVLMPGKGKIIITGQIGEVMKESVKAAYSLVRSKSKNFSIDYDIFNTNDVHIHVPEGAIPKDGPSAGVAMCIVLTSLFNNIKVKSDVAVTGEITLRGDILQIGGIKEKLLDAKRYNIKNVVVPYANMSDVINLSNDIKHNLNINYFKHIDDVLNYCLIESPFRI